MKLLLIEDDIESAKYLMKGLKEQGYVIDHCANGKEGLFMAVSEKYDAMIIDRCGSLTTALIHGVFDCRYRTMPLITAVNDASV